MIDKPTNERDSQMIDGHTCTDEQADGRICKEVLGKFVKKPEVGVSAV